MTWYHKVTRDLTTLPDALDYYESEYQVARTEVQLRGTVEKQAAAMPGLVEQRFCQLQEIESILEHLNIQLRKIKTKHYRKYLEGYNKVLSSRDAEKYAEGEDEVIDYNTLVNEVALMRNKWLGIIKSLDAKQFQINNIVKLRAAGMEDASV